MIEIRQIKLPAGSPRAELEKKIRKKLRLRDDSTEEIDWKILRHAVDARKKPDLFDVYNVGVQLSKREEDRLIRRLHDPNVAITRPVVYHLPEVRRTSSVRPCVIGAGPAGLFCALTLARAGLRPVVLERGQAMEERIKSVERFWKSGVLNPESNIQFGEGGAGTFSDGKLTTNVKDRTGKNRAILEAFVKAGAHENILYEHLPHIGTDVLRNVVVNLRHEIENLGGEFRFGCRVTGFQVSSGRLTGLVISDQGRTATLPCDTAVLAIGHSARDTFRTLYSMNLPMAQKNFAVGFRVSHPQSLINQAQYGISDAYMLRKMNLPAASYKLTAQTAKRGVYTFCMCPGGYVVNASSEQGRLAVNGMSDYARDSGRANGAVVMTVTPEDFGSGDVLAGMRFQEHLEERAFRMADGAVPVEKWKDFRQAFSEYRSSPEGGTHKRKLSEFAWQAESIGKFESVGQSESTEQSLSDRLCIRGISRTAPLHELLPKEMTADFITGMELFDQRIPGFAGEDAWVIGLESRTSSPVRILRDEHGESAVRGLYPCGEGAGYAGGIMSAAIDGMKTAEHIIAEE